MADDEVLGFLCGSLGCTLPALLLAGVAYRSVRRSGDELAAIRSRLDAQGADLAAMRGQLRELMRVPTQLREGEAEAGAATPSAEAAGLVATDVPPPAPAITLPAPPVAEAPPPPPRPRPPHAPRTAPPPAPEVPLSALVERYAVWIFAAFGALLGVLAVMFGLREAVRQGWLGPGARFAMGIGVGVAAGAAAEALRSRKLTTPADALFGIGAAALYASLFAGHARWDILPNGVAFAGMVAVTAATMFAAERRASRFAAILATAGGFATPVLLSTGENKALAFFAYLALVNAGVAWVSRRREWGWLAVGGGLVTSVLFAGWALEFGAPDQVPVGLAGATTFTVLYVASAFGVSGLQAVAGVLAGAMPWLTAALLLLHPLDPRGGVEAAPGLTAWLGAGWLLASAGGWQLVVRARWEARTVAAAALGLVALVYCVSHGLVDTPPWTPIAAVALGVPAVALALGGGLEAGVLLVVAGVVGLAGGAREASGAWVLALVAGIAALGAAAGWARGLRPLLVVGAVTSALPLYPGLLRALDDGVHLVDPLPYAGAWLVAYAVAIAPALLAARKGDLWGPLAAVAGTAVLFWPGVRLWSEAGGGGARGVLAILLGAALLRGVVARLRDAGDRLGDREVALLVSAVLFCVAVAVPLQLRNQWLTVGWAVEVALLAAASRRVTHPMLKVFGAALAAIVLVRLLVNPEALRYGDGTGPILLNWTLYTWGVPLVCLLYAARTFDGPPPLPLGLRVGAVLLGFALVNLEVAHAFAHDAQLSFSSENLGQAMTRSISWTVYGLVLIVIGVRGDSRRARLAGLVFALLGACKVFLVDLWSLSGFFKVGALAGVAVTLLFAAIAFQRMVLRAKESA